MGKKKKKSSTSRDSIKEEEVKKKKEEKKKEPDPPAPRKRPEMDEDLHEEIKGENSRDSRIEGLLVQILRELKAMNKGGGRP